MKSGINGKYPCDLVLVRKSKKPPIKIIIILLTINQIFFMVDHSLLPYNSGHTKNVIIINNIAIFNPAN